MVAEQKDQEEGSRDVNLSLQGHREVPYPDDWNAAQTWILRLHGNSITSLRGIRAYGDQIVYLDVSSNSLQSLDGLRHLSALKILNIACNRLRDLNGIEKLPRLQYGNFGYNNISDIRALKSTGSSLRGNLRYLDLRDNKVKTVADLQALDGYRALKEIWVRGNPVEQAVPDLETVLFRILTSRLVFVNGRDRNNRFKSDTFSTAVVNLTFEKTIRKFMVSTEEDSSQTKQVLGKTQEGDPPSTVNKSQAAKSVTGEAKDIIQRSYPVLDVLLAKHHGSSPQVDGHENIDEGSTVRTRPHSAMGERSTQLTVHDLDDVIPERSYSTRGHHSAREPASRDRHVLESMQYYRVPTPQIVSMTSSARARPSDVHESMYLSQQETDRDTKELVIGVIQRLEEENNSLRKQVKGLQGANKIVKLQKNMMQELRKDYERLETQSDFLQQEKESLESKVQLLKDKVENVRLQLEAQRQQNSVQSKTLGQLREEYTQLDLRVKEAESLSGEKTREIDRLKEAIQVEHQKKEWLHLDHERAIKDLHNQLDSAHVSHQQHMERLKDEFRCKLTKAIEDRIQQVTKANDERYTAASEDWNTQLAQNEREIAKLRLELTQLREIHHREILANQDHAQAMQNELLRLQEANSQLSKEVMNGRLAYDNLEEELREAVLEVQGLSEARRLALKTGTDRVQILEAKVQSYLVELQNQETLRNEAKDKTRRINELEADMDTLKSKLRNAEGHYTAERVKELEKLLYESKESKKTVEETLEEERITLKTYHRKILTLSERLDVLEAEKKDLREALSSEVNQHGELQGTYDQIREKYDDAKRQRDKAEARIESFTSANKELALTVQQQKEQLGHAEREITEIRTTMKEALTAKIAERDQRIEALTTDLAQAREQLQQSHRERDQFSAETAQLREAKGDYESLIRERDEELRELVVENQRLEDELKSQKARALMVMDRMRSEIATAS
eukprot:Clim_evm34s55 gene=Clim_evmTU34s55